MTTAVIQWGTGNVGRHALRGVLERPDLELVAVRVFDPDKVGVDAGDLVDGARVGVAATDDFGRILETKADVVLYNSLGTTLVDLQGPVDEVCALLRSGKNVISSAIDLFLYLKPGVAPAYVTPDMVAQLREACQTGGTSIYNVGMTPGFALDLWPVTMGRTVRKVESIHIRELVSLQRYRSSTVEFMGFGLPPDAEVEMFKMFVESPDNPAGGAVNTPYGATLHFIGDAFGVGLDEIVYTHRDVRVAQERLEMPGGVFERGTVVGTEFRLAGLVDGHEFVTIDFLWRIDDDGWPPNLCAWELEIEGDPSVRSRMEFATETDARRATSITVAGHCINAIPQVVAAAPGIVDHFSLPLFTGRAAASLR